MSAKVTLIFHTTKQISFKSTIYSVFFNTSENSGKNIDELHKKVG
ncbi:hypothetical protein MED217_11314 [Leeuwenhoekiella blandensis MED217]|jgi:hypothetical protein|uniref:Uncharacterized protein n=1 Tax=Leeuwenhoekiella blandensis (strain CECT 7118 / CCUG 51940 / KCTC 22103 / MED217) TaxID=398720 RepID=A3XLY4_LEEBM|nr:hypothetical protein MED217_11314 [Leeuwenhoekiella blandensis MED217]